MSLDYNKKLIPLAKGLRKNATPQENELWYKFLRHFPVRFQRQKVIDGYIVDFYCHQARLVIELDGFQHYSPESLQYDAPRSATFAKRGLQVLRFTNQDIDRQFAGVCTATEAAVNANTYNQKEGSS